jgi:outer membrane protein OmpA-like peptidoglycan-associated protein
MKLSMLTVGAMLAGSLFAPAQNQPTQNPKSGSAPIYHVTVVERTVKAVNYLYRSGPTQIDFRGTVLMPEGKGIATVESRQGRTEINASLEHFKPSQQYGREYLTYVLWAITPEGRPHNLGEIVPDHSNNGHIRVTTDLQAFAMIVTAEPYSAVRQPGDVVVLENQIRPDTEGSTETVNAKYELLPRGQYTWNINDNLSAEIANAPKVSEREFETLTELYQAENAVGVAGSVNARQYAPETLARAQQLLQEAQQMHTARADSHRVIEIARQASQTAEDARLIAVQRQQQDSLQAAQSDAAKARQEAVTAQRSADEAVQKARADADLQVRQAREEADAAVQRANALQQQAQSDRAAAAQAQSQAQSEIAAARARAQQAEIAAAQSHPDPARDATRTSALRVRLLENLNGVLPATDTPRGLVVTVSDADFSGESVRGTAAEKVARISAIVAAQPGLRVRVEGYSDSAAKQAISEVRATAVRRVLTNTGLSADLVSSSGLGDSRPIGPPGLEENSRVEIVISGDPIGSLPFWDHTYSLTR